MTPAMATSSCESRHSSISPGPIRYPRGRNDVVGTSLVPEVPGVISPTQITGVNPTVVHLFIGLRRLVPISEELSGIACLHTDLANLTNLDRLA